MMLHIATSTASTGPLLAGVPALDCSPRSTDSEARTFETFGAGP